MILLNTGDYMNITKQDIILNPNFPLEVMDVIIDPFMEEPSYHWHDCLEISYVKKGRGRYLVDGREYIMEPGDVIIFNNIEPHTWKAFPPEPMVQPVLVFNPSLIWSGEANLFDYQYLRPFLERSTNFSNKLPGNNVATKEIFMLLLQIDEEYKNKPIGYKLMIKAKLLQIITTLIRYFQDDKKTSEDISVKQEQLARLQTVLDFINNNFTQDIRLTDAASIAYMNCNYFSTFFKKTMGLSFKEYIIKLRVTHASKLLKVGNKSTTEVACESGFNSISNFYKAYKKFSDKPL